MKRVLVIGLMALPIVAQADVWTFATPSENIQCVVGEDFGGSDLTCTIINREGPTALPRPAGCASDWGHAFFMQNRGTVTLECKPLDRSKNGFDRAEYGVRGEFGGFVCQSEKTGLECWNEDGHGFFLSRRSQRVF